jgi:hypothetical protein
MGLVRVSAALACELERLEASFAQSEGADKEALDLYGRAAGNLRRIYESLGLQRRARDVTPTLSAYLASKRTADSPTANAGQS